MRRATIRRDTKETKISGALAIEVRDALRERAILVRDRSYEAPGCVRITVGTRKQTRELMAALEEIWRR